MTSLHKVDPIVEKGFDRRVVNKYREPAIKKVYIIEVG